MIIPTGFGDCVERLQSPITLPRAVSTRCMKEASPRILTGHRFGHQRANPDSNSTRTESYVAIRPDPEGPMQVDSPKAAGHNGCQQIICPSREMRAGLKNQKANTRKAPSGEYEKQNPSALTNGP